MSSEFSIIENLIDKPEFSIFVKGLALSGLVEKLKETGPFTVMAPSNLAFTALPEAKLIEIMKPLNKENLAEIMKYHIIEGKWRSEFLANFTSVMTVQYQSLRIEKTDFGFKVNDAKLQNHNFEASNGVIHGISAVLFPAIATEAV